MAAYFALNGVACLLPSQLLDESEEHPDIDFCLDDWEGKANAFHHRRGSLPSFGYFLCTEPSVNPFVRSGLTIIYQDGIEKKFNVDIETAKKITPAYFQHKGFYVVKVCDERRTLSDTFVGKRYNLVESFSPSQNSTTKGTFKYVKETMKEVSSTLSVPYEWKDLFEEVFKLPSEQKLQVSGITFPTYVPQDLDWRYTTRQEALECLLQWTGTTIVYQEIEGQNWKLVELKDPGNNSRDSLVDQYVSVISKNRFPQYKKYGSVAPSKFKLHFRKLKPDNSEVDEYLVTEKVPPITMKSGQELSVRLPSYFVNDSSAPQTPDTIATDWINRSKDYLGFFPSQEKTYEGLLCNPPNLTGTQQSSAYPLRPSAFIETVVWFDVGDGPKTLLVSASPREWVPRPKPIEIPGKDTTRIAVGRVVGNISSAQPTFVVNFLRSVVGALPASEVFVNNTHKQQYSDGDTITIFSEEESPVWDTDRSGGTGSNLIRFELVGDLDKEDFTVQGYLLDQIGNRVKVANTTIDQKVLLGNAWQIHQGKGPRKDGLYGELPGYRGYALLVASNDLGSIYQIVLMEAQARWVIGKTLKEVEPDATSFPAHVDKFWGAFPNDREPVTEIIEEGTSQDDPTYGIKVWDELGIIRSTIKQDTKYLAVWDEENNKYILTNIGPGEADKIERYALLVRDIPKAEWTLDKCNHGYADAAAIVFSKQRDDPDDKSSLHFFKKTGTRKPVINPNWPEIIKAGETTNAAKPVVARGYLDDWTLGDGQEKEVFVITSLVYPMTIVKGTSVNPISGTGNFSISNVSTLWGRNPKVSSLIVANPEGWDGPAGALVYAMQIADGTWLALYITCPR